MKPTRRALRRHHRERMLRRALRSFVVSCPYYDEHERRQRALRWFNNLKMCSCYMCGNPRKYYGALTLQERRLLEAAWAEAEEV